MDENAKEIAEKWAQRVPSSCKCGDCALCDLRTLAAAYLAEREEVRHIEEPCARRPAMADCATLREKVGTALAACATMDREVHTLRAQKNALAARVAELEGVLLECAGVLTSVCTCTHVKRCDSCVLLSRLYAALAAAGKPGGGA